MKRYQDIHDRSILMSTEGIQKDMILTFIANELEKMLDPGCAVSILLLDKEGLLRNGASPSLPKDYLKAIDGIKPHPNLGTCAAAAATGQIVVTSSFLDDDKWSELKHLPLSIGFIGAWSVPIKDQQNFVLGTIGVYQSIIKAPHHDDKIGLELLTKAAVHILSSN
jgi:hypothetical protein